MVDVNHQSALQWAIFCGKVNVAKRLTSHAIEAEMHQATAAALSSPSQASSSRLDLHAVKWRLEDAIKYVSTAVDSTHHMITSLIAGMTSTSC